MTNTIDFNHDQITKAVNKKLRKHFGVGCNCFLCWDPNDKCHRLTFVEMADSKTPTKLMNAQLNHLFFDSLRGVSFKEGVTQKQIDSYILWRLNYFKDRKRFLLSLFNLYVEKYGMTETGAINEVYKWQAASMCITWRDDNVVHVFVDIDLLDDFTDENHVLYKMTQAVDIQKHGKVEYKVVELDMNTLETTMDLYQ